MAVNPEAPTILPARTQIAGDRIYAHEIGCDPEPTSRVVIADAGTGARLGARDGPFAFGVLGAGELRRAGAAAACP